VVISHIILRKHIGYKDFASFTSRSEDCIALRRIDRLHCRVLLFLQDEIFKLEKDLDTIDEQKSAPEAEDIDNGTFRGDIPERRNLLKTAAPLMEQYGIITPWKTTLPLRN
jgi:hypothetical protein